MTPQKIKQYSISLCLLALNFSCVQIPNFFCERNVCRALALRSGAISTKDLDGWIFCKIRRAWVKLWWASVKMWVLEAPSASSATLLQCFSFDVANQEVVWLLPGSVRILTEELLHQKQNTGLMGAFLEYQSDREDRFTAVVYMYSRCSLFFNMLYWTFQECVLCCLSFPLVPTSNFKMSSSISVMPKGKTWPTEVWTRP